MGNDLKKIPIMFQQKKLYNVDSVDTRFVKMSIWLMHTGRNYNGSCFSKEVIQDAIPSLSNTPILCNMEMNINGEMDFSDHAIHGDKHYTTAIGVIPENNNAHFQTRLCDDGIEREYLVVDGLIWTKWDEPLKILNKKGIKPQSMELHEEYDGGESEDGYFHFSKFKFFGSCILGDDVQPAMNSSTVELQFSKQDIAKQIEEKLTQFTKYVESNKNSEVNKMGN